MSEEEALRRLQDQDAEPRLRAVLALEGEGKGLKALIGAIERGPDPRVRAAATVGLEECEEFAAVQALVGALDDPNAEVVVEVIDSLEFAGDASVVPSLKPLLAHSDARVRKAAADAIRLLEEAWHRVPPEDERLCIRISSRLAVELRYGEREVQSASWTRPSRPRGGSRIPPSSRRRSTTAPSCAGARPTLRPGSELNAEVTRVAEGAGDLELALSGQRGVATAHLELGDTSDTR